MITLIILLVFICYVVTVEAAYSYKAKKLHSYNEGYQAGYKDSLEAAILYAKNATEKLCTEYESQFKGKIETSCQTAKVISECVHPLTLKTQSFFVETYTVTFLLEPSLRGYRTFANDNKT